MSEPWQPWPQDPLDDGLPGGDEPAMTGPGPDDPPWLDEHPHWPPPDTGPDPHGHSPQPQSDWTRPDGPDPEAPIGYGDDLAATEPVDDDPATSWPPGDDTPAPQTEQAPAGQPGWSAVLGADPDLRADDDTWPWQPIDIPEPLDIPLPEPVDGPPWADPAELGHPDTADQLPPPPAQPPAADLATYAAIDLPPDTDPWPLLRAADDPATSALARFWNTPPTGGG